MAALSPGTRLGTYAVVAPIGAGGMGEVYRARDTELARDVAIKVLPEDFAADEERLARFRREAQVLASLNHPNIATIYGTEKNALVLELVEGPTLAERIAQGPIPLDEAIAIARQISEALEAAHEAGVIHRDLKPANIKVQEDGTVKVLDFGLAKAIEGEAKGDASESPTMTAAATRAGVIMGTAAYMSPEQARGKSVDRRADIWAFGAVLYEMLTGRRAFEAEDISLTLAEVMKSEPDWDALPAELSPTLRMVLTRCLEKNPKRRVPDIGVLRLVMDGAFETDQPQPNVARSARSAGTGWRAVGAALVLGSVVTGVALWSTRPDPARPVVRSILSTSSQPPLLTLMDTDFTITPDGTRVVYRSMADGPRLVVRDVSKLEASTLSDDGSLRSPFVSPSGEWIGFFTGRTLQKVSIRGGPPVTICETTGGARGASWGADDTIVFATNAPTGLMRVAASGGEPEELTVPGADESDHFWPEILPGGGAVLYTVSGVSGMSDRRIAMVFLDDGSSKTLIPAGRSPRYAPTGHIVYANQDALLAVGFDLDRLEVTTDPVPVGIVGVAADTNGTADFAIAQNGSLVYLIGPTSAHERTLAWVDREGREEAIGAQPNGYEYFRISPDGTKLALDVCCDEDDSGIWVWDLTRDAMTRLTFDAQRTYYPLWTPDGSRIAFATRRGISMNLFWKSADGTGAIERLSDSANDQTPSAFTPDGRRMVFWEVAETSRDLLVRSMDDDARTERLLATEYSEAYAQISPDGKWIAYRSDASGQQEIWVRPFPDVDGGEWQVSIGGGHRPRWSPAGRELFYLSPSGRLMSVRYETDPFTHENPELVLEEPFSTTSQFGAVYDVHPDGQRFVKIKEGAAGDDADPPQLILVQNWLDELERLVPTDR